MQSSLLGACVLETDRPDTAEYDQVPTALASGGNTWKSPLPRAGRCRPCSASSCDAGAHPASSAEDGSQKPPCDPRLTPPTMFGESPCRSIRRVGGLVQTPLCRLNGDSDSSSISTRQSVRCLCLIRSNFAGPHKISHSRG